jgi:SAM-dependent methyltransferase
VTQLADASLLYRRPELYHALATPDTDTILNLVGEHRPVPATSLLDLGCGTGNLLADLPAQFATRVGVDLQTGMVEYAGRRHPRLEVRQGDIRTIRLGRTFDAVTCVGNTLAYLHTDADLQAALATIAAHTHPRAVVVIQTLTDLPGSATPQVADTVLDGLRARVRTGYEWVGPMVTMHRRWMFEDGAVAEDRLSRRVWTPSDLAAGLIEVGLRPVSDVDFLTAVR